MLGSPALLQQSKGRIRQQSSICRSGGSLVLGLLAQPEKDSNFQTCYPPADLNSILLMVSTFTVAIT